jgi:dipeptidase D
VAIADSVLSGLEPEAFWTHFEALSGVARPSRGEGPAIAHVQAWAAARGLETLQDAAGNMVVRVPATAGRETAATVTLQGHLDMVCERRPDSAYDAAAGRIRLVRDGDWVHADGTTLGADDGVAIAAMMALADDADVRHGPLELLMTVAEEVGIEGAARLDPSLVTGSILLNLDSEDDRELTVGCAGSTDTWVHVTEPRARLEPGVSILDVAVTGGLGGHSGIQIAEGRSNAIKVLGGVLRDVLATEPFRLVALTGGKSRNAIPRDALATCTVPAGREAAFGDAVAAAGAAVADAFARTDPGVTATVGPAAAIPADAWTATATMRLLDVLALVPTGPIALSPDFAGVIETSTSLGEAITDGAVLTFHSLSRSASDAAMPEVLGQLAALARLAGGTIDVQPNYRGWPPDPDSRVLAAARRVYERLFGEAPVVTAMHAGLEPAVIGERVPGLDMLAIGPVVEAPHSPDERLSIPSVARFWRLLTALLDELSA